MQHDTASVHHCFIMGTNVVMLNTFKTHLNFKMYVSRSSVTLVEFYSVVYSKIRVLITSHQYCILSCLYFCHTQHVWV